MFNIWLLINCGLTPIYNDRHKKALLNSYTVLQYFHVFVIV